MKDFKIYIIAASLLLVLYVVIEYNKPKPVNWQATLYYDDKIPFGTYVFYHQLDDIFAGARVTNTNKSIYNLFTSERLSGNYIIVAKSVNFTKVDFNELVKYIEAGHTVFITSFEWGGYLSNTLEIRTKTESDKEKTSLNFTNNLLKRTKDYRFDKNISDDYFSNFDTARATVISKNAAGNSTYLSFKFGQGKLLICANPLLFTNYSLLTPQGADYAAKALSYLPANQNIYWDEYQNHDIEDEKSPMRVFFNNPSLQWAYYLSLFTLLVFVLFEVKRRQRVIPVIEPLKNSTLDFVKVVGQVYYEKRDNTNIAYKKILYLLSYWREQYQLKTNKLDNEFIDALAHKTGLELIFARELVDYINYLTNQSRVTDHELIVLNQLIEKFNSQS